MAIYNAHM